MKNNPLYERLREASWGRELTPAEQEELRSWLAAHPDERADWEAEAALNVGLGRLPEALVPTNFTARVLQALEREASSANPQKRVGWRLWHWRLRWLEKVALASVVIAAGLLTYYHEQAAKIDRVRRSVVTVLEVPPLANPEILENFDAIQAMGQAQAADEELIKLMQ